VSESNKDSNDRRDQGDAGPAAYEPPRITWREPYEPVASSLSCVKQPGNPPCASGPTTS
jgi:hypothetical protein